MEIDTNTTEGKIKIMQAFLDGKTIQYKSCWGEGWYDVEGEPLWDWENIYRIKPEFKTLYFALTKHKELDYYSVSEPYDTEDEVCEQIAACGRNWEIVKIYKEEVQE